MELVPAKRSMQFLLCDHGLEVEKGRYRQTKIAREDRVCAFCATLAGHNIGDEKHVLDECLQFSENRDQLLGRISSFGIDLSMHGSSVTSVLVQLDHYSKPIRMKVWRAVALFVQTISRTYAEKSK